MRTEQPTVIRPEVIRPLPPSAVTPSPGQEPSSGTVPGTGLPGLVPTDELVCATDRRPLSGSFEVGGTYARLAGTASAECVAVAGSVRPKAAVTDAAKAVLFAAVAAAVTVRSAINTVRGWIGM